MTAVNCFTSGYMPSRDTRPLRDGRASGKIARMDPAKVRTFDFESTPVRCIETEDGRRVWLCECAPFHERAKRHAEGFCAHTAVAIMRCIQDGSIEVR